MNDGWIKLHRKILESPLWLSCKPERKVILLTLIMLANHKEKKIILDSTGEEITVLPGQLVTSRIKLAEKCGKGISEQMVRSALNYFEKAKFLTKQSTNKSTKGYTLITIVNWNFYQSKEENQPSNQPTNQPLINQGSTTNKNVKNEKNKKNIYYAESSIEYQLSNYLLELIRKNNQGFICKNIQTWCNDMNKMIRLDKRNTDDIKRVIEFSQESDFWYKNILSVGKLRKQFDQLYLQAKPNNPTQKSNTVNFRVIE